MNRIKAFGAFWYDFVIGDDWQVAAIVVAGLALTGILVHAAHVNAWWLLPLFVFAALGWSLHRATARKSLSRTIPPVSPPRPSSPPHPHLAAFPPTPAHPRPGNPAHPGRPLAQPV